MSDKDLQDGVGPRKAGLGRGLTAAIAAVVLVGAASAVYVIRGSALKPDAPVALKSLATGGMEKLAETTPKPAPTTKFVDAEGKFITLADLKGDVVVLNLWATWCAPCKKEMPTLAKLAAAYEGKPVKVVALSIDRAEDTEGAKAFIAQNAPLAFYQDASMALPYAFEPEAAGFPTTILFDKSGMERARLSGEADWSTVEANAVVDRLLAE
jgi:thiol-disulfide isomerase/thioredoxin